VHACLDDLVIALYVTIEELLEPRQGPGHPPKLADSELICLAVAHRQAFTEHAARLSWHPCGWALSGRGGIGPLAGLAWLLWCYLGGPAGHRRASLATTVKLAVALSLRELPLAA
jgi:hypothetical protein